MDWKEYEQVTKSIYEALGKDSGVKIECFGNSCKVHGKSGVPHQVDVLTSHTDGLHKYLTAIECKYWKDNINKDIVMKVAEIVEDAGLNKGVIVSKKGFTPDGVSFAKYKNIGLIELREMQDSDWEGRIKNISINIHMLLPEITSLELIVSEDDNVETSLERGQVRVDFLEVEKKSGERRKVREYIEEFSSELSKKAENEEFTTTYKLDKESKFIYQPTNEAVPILGFKLSGILRVMKKNVEIKGEDHVWLYMKSIFEDRTYTISKDGEINERKKLSE